MDMTAPSEEHQMLREMVRSWVLESVEPQAQPSININAQYIQDLSFENPRAPDSLTAGQPEV